MMEAPERGAPGPRSGARGSLPLPAPPRSRCLVRKPAHLLSAAAFFCCCCCCCYRRDLACRLGSAGGPRTSAPRPLRPPSFVSHCDSTNHLDTPPALHLQRTTLGDQTKVKVGLSILQPQMRRLQPASTEGVPMASPKTGLSGVALSLHGSPRACVHSCPVPGATRAMTPAAARKVWPKGYYSRPWWSCRAKVCRIRGGGVPHPNSGPHTDHA